MKEKREETGKKCLETFSNEEDSKPTLKQTKKI